MNSSMQEIYTQLWHEHVQSVRNYCYSKLKGRPEDAEDMLQEAFALLWRKIITDGVPPNPRAWLLTTINNLSMTEYKHTSRNNKNISSVSLDGTVILYTDKDIAETLEKEELKAQLVKALTEELTDDERRLIKYETVDEIPQAQIAEILGQSLSATKMQIFRLKRKLRQIKKEKEKV